MFVHLLSLLLAQATPLAVPTPRPTGPVYAGEPATTLTLESRPLGVDPDGDFKWVVIARYLDAQGNPTKIMLNSDLDWLPDRGKTQWQPRMRFGQPAAMVRVNELDPVRIRVRSNKPQLADAFASIAPADWRGPRVVAGALGPHMIQIGWFPQEHHAVTIVREDPAGKHRQVIATLRGVSQTFRDTTVAPGKMYRYIVTRAGAKPVALPPVAAMPEPPPSAVSALSGKGVWLYFGTNPADDHFIGSWNAQPYIDQAARAGLHYIELRTAYGAYWELDQTSRPVVDAIVDGLAAKGIGTVGWTVPREASYEDILASVKTAYYRTAKGTGFTGLAIDYERGDEFLHDCPQGCKAIADYALRLRQAMGPHYTLTATIEDPYLEHLDNSKYPYTAVARVSDVLQPMAYWRMMSRKTMDVAKMNGLLQGSYQKVLEVSGRKLPISIGGQTSPEGALGNPPPEEIVASLAQAKALGAIGECFFDWDGTLPEQWDALAGYTW